MAQFAPDEKHDVRVYPKKRIPASPLPLFDTGDYKDYVFLKYSLSVFPDSLSSNAFMSGGKS